MPMPDTDPPQAGNTLGATCSVCPLCMLLGGAAGLHPEVTAHLRAAGRELGLALRAALDGAAAGSPAQAEAAPTDLDDP